MQILCDWRKYETVDVVVGDQSSSVQADAVAGEIAQTDAAAGETVVGEQSSSVQADPLAGEAAQSDAAAGGSADSHDSGVIGAAHTHTQPHPTPWWPTVHLGDPFFVQEVVPGTCPISGSVGCLGPEISHFHTGTNVVEGEMFLESLAGSTRVCLCSSLATQIDPQDRA